ncbi:DNA mismatch repair protein [Neisseria gonorrhoeae]|nr:DNA mismatch repair protein [Neisseria gonorrhoeae]
MPSETPAHKTDTPLSDGIPSQSELPPLGFAIAQLLGIYILAQAEDSLLLIDMHAAAERVNYEKMKRQRQENGNLQSQHLLIPVTFARPTKNAPPSPIMPKRWQASAWNCPTWAATPSPSAPRP